MKHVISAAILCGSLVACAQVNSASTQIQNACIEAAPLVPFAGPLAPYITASCTADGIVKLASDPSSVQWMGEIIGKVKALKLADNSSIQTIQTFGLEVRDKDGLVLLSAPGLSDLR